MSDSLPSNEESSSGEHSSDNYGCQPDGPALERVIWLMDCMGRMIHRCVVGARIITGLCLVAIGIFVAIWGYSGGRNYADQKQADIASNLDNYEVIGHWSSRPATQEDAERFGQQDGNSLAVLAVFAGCVIAGVGVLVTAGRRE
jgi:hypothetical protein